MAEKGRRSGRHFPPGHCQVSPRRQCLHRSSEGLVNQYPRKSWTRLDPFGINGSVGGVVRPMSWRSGGHHFRLHRKRRPDQGDLSRKDDQPWLLATLTTRAPARKSRPPFFLTGSCPRAAGLPRASSETADPLVTCPPPFVDPTRALACWGDHARLWSPHHHADYPSRGACAVAARLRASPGRRAAGLAPRHLADQHGHRWRRALASCPRAGSPAGVCRSQRLRPDRSGRPHWREP